MSAPSEIVVHGWTIFVHPLLIDQIEMLVKQVDRAKRRNSRNYKKTNANKRLTAIRRLIFDVIPQDPMRVEYRQGLTLGVKRKHWFRAKFFQQYRLFFRFHAKSKIIVFAWVNDDKSKRAYGNKTDAYRVFGKMLNSGNPPDDWTQLLKQAKGELDRLNAVTNRFVG